LEGVEGEALVATLDLRGICVSTGSACHAGISRPSHVLTAMGMEETRALGAIRLSLCEDNTEEEVERLLEIVPEVVARLRELSPDWNPK
jgi:cysteine desulfurase